MISRARFTLKLPESGELFPPQTRCLLMPTM
jgi:hypothetical protein